jgi:hypothetical protein
VDQDRKLNAGQAIVLDLVRKFINNPPSADDIYYDDEGTPWVRVPAQVISDQMLEQYHVAFSVRRTRSALNRVVEKGHLVRTQHVGSHKWSTVYFYRLPVAQQPPASE